MRYFISDLHNMDGNIITYEHRPFADCEEMRNKIICNWNKAVNDTDEVFLLGDIGDPEILNFLKGKIFVVCGNHDDVNKLRDMQLQLKPNIIGISEYPIMVGPMWLSHEPIGYVPPECPYINIHGHLHRFIYGMEGRMWSDGNRYFNVSVEQINYTPISDAEIIRQIGYKKV